MYGEWSKSLNAWWSGLNGIEHIAWKGSHQIFVYPPDDYPNPPMEIWQYHKRIETLEDFTDALENSIKLKVDYNKI